MRVSVVQREPGADKGANSEQARRLSGEAAAADRPDMMALPEIWTCLGGDHATKMAQAEPLPPRELWGPGPYPWATPTDPGAAPRAPGG